MFLNEFLFVLAIAIIVGAVFAAVFRQMGAWAGLLWFFAILLLGTWAIGGWMQPVGPELWGVSWVPFVFAAVMIALIIAAVTPPSPRRIKRRTPATEHAAEASEEEALAFGVTIFLWCALLLSVVAIAGRYLYEPYV